MMLIFSLFGFVLGATSCSDLEFQCGSGKCIDITKYCDGFRDCLDKSDEVVGCGECILNDLKKFLYKDKMVKTVYQSGEKIKISCPLDGDDEYGYDYGTEETSELTCHNGRWVGDIPKCIGDADSRVKSTPKPYLDVVTNTNEFYSRQYASAGSTSYARTESGNTRIDDVKSQPDFGSSNTTEELFTDKECILNDLKKFLYKDKMVKTVYQSGEKVKISCPLDGDDEYGYDYGTEETSELTCHNGRWVGDIPKCIGDEDSRVKSTPKPYLDVVTNTNEFYSRQYASSGSTSYARTESGNTRIDDVKSQPDFGSSNTTEELFTDKECILNDLKKFLYKDKMVKTVYQSGEKVKISCPLDGDDEYGYDYGTEETSELTCHNGRWVGDIPKCIGDADLRVKSTPKPYLDVVTNTNEFYLTQYYSAGSTSYARTESGNTRIDDVKSQPDFGSSNTTEELFTNKGFVTLSAEINCQLNALSQYLTKNQPTQESYRHGQKISIACITSDPNNPEYDYHQFSDDSHVELTCHDGQWIGYYPECFTSCLPIVLKDYLMEEQDAMKEYRSGEMISVSCSRNKLGSQGKWNLWNYEYDDQANADRTRNLTCLNGRWVGEYPECFERCRRSRIQGSLVTEPESEYLLPGDVVKIQICWGNIPVEGDGHLTCMANGRWHGNATCPSQSDSDCFTPPALKNAYISGKRWDRYPEGAMITYKCGQAFLLKGNNKLTCVNGKWTEEQFYCIIRMCLYPGKIENGQILNITVEVGQYVHFRCDEGYILTGPHIMLCYADGKFHSKMIPTCKAVQCQPLKPPEHGWIEQRTNYNGATLHDYRSYAMVRCEEGYRVIGTVRRQCQADGTWSGDYAICQRIRPVCELSSLVLRYGRFQGVNRMTIVHGESVSIRKTVKCDDGYTVPPNISYFSCYNGTLDPPNVDCIKYDYSIRQCHLSTNMGQVIRYRDKCYLATHWTFISNGANRFCQNLGPNAYLAMIPDKETNEAIGYLMNMAPGEKMYWIGAMWNSHNFRWEWPNGKGLNYTNWKSGEVRKTVKIFNFNQCSVVTSDGRWANTVCSYAQKYKAMCEIAAN